MAGTTRSENDLELYSPAARRFHWGTVALVFVQIPLGLAMALRTKLLDIWDAVTNAMYSTHKLLGMTILVVVLARLAYRLGHGAPSDEPSLEPWQKLASSINHWGLYALLIVVPMLGWLGVSYYPALDIFGLFSLPGLVAPDQPAADRVFRLHFIGAMALALLIGIHVAAALFHYLIRKDNVLGRMWPALVRKS
jgi:cytochrome b561